MKQVGGRGRWVMRWFLAGRGPLKRGSDRLEMIFRLLLLVALCQAAPIGVLVGSSVHAQQARVAAEQARDRHPVHAHLLGDPATPNTDALEATTPATVGWTGPDGARKTAELSVLATARRGDTVTVWLTRDGRLTAPPLDRGGIAGTAVCAGILAGLAIVLVGWGQLLLVRHLLDTRRVRRWEREWSTVEPLWRAYGR